MTVNSLQSVLRGSNGTIFRFIFADGGEMLAEVVSDTHVDVDDTIIVLHVGAAPDECGWQIHLADISALATSDGCWLFKSKTV